LWSKAMTCAVQQIMIGSVTTSEKEAENTLQKIKEA